MLVFRDTRSAWAYSLGCNQCLACTQAIHHLSPTIRLHLGLGFQCSGSFIQDCFPLPSQPQAGNQCSSSSTDTWAQCSPTTNAARIPLMALVGSGRGSDGRQGSMCSTAGAEMRLECQQGLTCVPLPASYLGPNLLQVRFAKLLR